MELDEGVRGRSTWEEFEGEALGGAQGGSSRGARRRPWRSSEASSRERSSVAEQGIRGTMWNAMGVLKDGATIQKTPRRRPEAGPACVDIAFPGDLLNAEISLVVRLGPRGNRANTEARASGAEHLERPREQIVCAPRRLMRRIIRAEIAPNHAQVRPRNVHGDHQASEYQSISRACGSSPYFCAAHRPSHLSRLGSTDCRQLARCGVQPPHSAHTTEIDLAAEE